MENKLKKEFQFYIDHQKELVEKYSNKFIVIKDNEVTGSYDSQGEAYKNASEKFELGTFLIQFCTSGKSGYTQVFHSRVSFS